MIRLDRLKCSKCGGTIILRKEVKAYKDYRLNKKGNIIAIDKNKAFSRIMTNETISEYKICLICGDIPKIGE